MYCGTASSSCTYMLKGYFDEIPSEIDEAGRVDDLSPLGVFRRLVRPLAKRSIHSRLLPR